MCIRDSLREHLSAHPCVFLQREAVQLCRLDQGLMICELTHEVVAARQSRPAEERIGHCLHPVLSLRDAAPPVGRADHMRKNGSVARGQFLLDLEKQGMVHPIPERKDGVVACPHASGPDYLEGDVDEVIRCLLYTSDAADEED